MPEPLAIKQAREWVEQISDPLWPNMTEGDWAVLMRDVLAEYDTLRGFVLEIRRLASDPFASETVALRACLLAAFEALGLPGPEPSPERDIARAIIKEARGDA